MIKINLLGDDTVIDTSGTWLIISYALSVFVVGLVFTLLQLNFSSSIEERMTEQQSLESNLKALQEVTKEVRDLDKKRKELTEKTRVIGILKKSKLGPVRVLDDLNNAIPDKSWLYEARESGGLMKISGLALDNQTIATFMKSLESSNYFETVDLGESRQVEKENVKIKDFALQAKVTYAGKDAAPPPTAATNEAGGGK